METKVQSDSTLPKNPIVWDGPIPTFPTFWVSLSRRVSDNSSINDNDKLDRILNRIPTKFRPMLSGLSLEDTKAVLEKKFRSSHTVQMEIKCVRLNHHGCHKSSCLRTRHMAQC